MSGALVLIILIFIMAVFMFTVQAISKHSDQPILSEKDVLEALKNNKEAEHKNKIQE